MSRTESPEGAAGSANGGGYVSGPGAAVDSAALVRWAGRLASYAVATLAVTFVLLRPSRRGPAKRGSLFFGSGLLAVLFKTIFLAGDGAETAPARPVPAVAAAAPAARPPGAAPATTKARRPERRKTGVSRVSTGSAPRPVATKVPDAVAEAPAQPKPAAPVPVAKTAAALPPAPQPAPGKPAAQLGPRYADKAGGFSLQFPAGWTHKSYTDGGRWVVDASDVSSSALISVGFSAFPAEKTIDQVPAEKLTKALQKRTGGVVHASGYATIAGRRCMWHKYTAPTGRPGDATPMTMVHYHLPLHNGRALELRVAAAPDKFNEMAPRMKQAVDTLKLLTPVADARR